jgi:mersacidin/lichenicidin family type 2 lantibiotic
MAIDVARAWKDSEYRKTLTPEELASLPPNPAGPAHLTEDVLEAISGAPGAPACTWARSGCDLQVTK